MSQNNKVALISSHPVAGLKFLRSYPSVEAAREDARTQDPHKNPDLPRESYAFLIVECADVIEADEGPGEIGDATSRK